jgi:predicted dehydrogenase
MVKYINAGIIGCNMSEEFFRTTETNNVENFLWKKIFLSDHSPSFLQKLHKAEIVEHPEAIFNDAEIELVFISADHLQFVKPVIEAGKSVRLV